MATPVILVDGVAPPPLGAKANGKKTSGATVALTLQSTVGINSLTWQVDHDSYCTASVANANPTYPFATTATITGSGSYRLTATANGNQAGNERAVALLYVPTAGGNRIPIPGEQTEFDTAEEWHDTLRAAILGASGGTGSFTADPGGGALSVGTAVALTATGTPYIVKATAANIAAGAIYLGVLTAQTLAGAIGRVATSGLCTPSECGLIADGALYMVRANPVTAIVERVAAYVSGDIQVGSARFGDGTLILRPGGALTA